MSATSEISEINEVAETRGFRARVARLWVARDELSLHSIRWSNWSIVLLFACGNIAFSFRLGDLNQDMFGIDSYTLELMSYGVAILIYAFVPRKAFIWLMRTGAFLCLALLIFESISGIKLNLPLYMLFGFGNGLCLGSAIFIFFFRLNNAERLLNMIAIEIASLLSAVFWEAAWGAFEYGLPIALCCFFAVASLACRNTNMRSPGAEPEAVSEQGKTPEQETGTATESIRQETQSGFADEHHPIALTAKNQVGIGGAAAVFYIYIIYLVVELIYIYLIYEMNYASETIFLIGNAAGIAVCIILQLLRNQTVWHTWNIFLLLSIVAIGLLMLNTPSSVYAGTFSYGLVYSLGYIATFYIVGGAACLSRSILFFRAFCIIEFASMCFLSPGLEQAFGSITEHYNEIALLILLVVACTTMALWPVMQRKLFDTDWVGNLAHIDPKKYAEQIRIVENATRPDKADEVLAEPDISDTAGSPGKGLDLTPRETQVFTLLLTDLPPKQIAYDLKISYSTFDFHRKNLYRKLNIQSRTELFALYSGHAV